jgi:hypothetical protein
MNKDEFKEARKRLEYWEALAGEEIRLTEKLNQFRPWPRSKKRETFYPSDAERCSLALYWYLRGEKESNPDFSDEQINIFSLGDSIEAAVGEKYKRMPGPVWTGVGGGYYLPGYEEDYVWQNDVGVRPQITYYMDIIWRDEEGLVMGEPYDYIVEVKSIAQFPFHSSRNKHREYTWYGADQIPKVDHYTQIQLYLHGEGKEYGLIHYYCKNDGNEKVWLVRRDDAYIADVFTRLTETFERVVAGDQPPRPYTAYPARDNTRLLKGTKVDGRYHKSDWHCLYCAFASKCWQLKGYEKEE